jgi:hypothetical protein
VLIAPEIDHAQAVLLTAEQFVELYGSVFPEGMGCGNCAGIDAAEAVEQGALLGLIEAGKALALGVDQG